MGCCLSREGADSAAKSAPAVPATPASASPGPPVPEEHPPTEIPAEPAATGTPPAAAPTSPNDDDDGFPLTALSLAAIAAIASSADPTWTAEDVKHKIVLPATEKTKTAFVATDATSQQANLFCSHAWRYKFVELVAALEHWAQQNGEDPSSTFVWIDLFSVNQHTSHNVTQEWWSTVFATGIRTTSRVVLVLAPWSDPIPLTRAWCLWEIFNAAQLRDTVFFDVALSEQQEAALAEAITTDPGAIVPTLCELDGAKAAASRPEDLEMILSAIKAAGGMTVLNTLVQDFLRSWLASTVAKMLEKHAPEPAWRQDDTMIHYRHQTAVLYDAVGQPDKSLALEEEVLEAMKSKLGPQHTDTLTTMNNLATTYAEVGQPQRGLALAEEVLAARSEVLGPEHPRTLTTMANLASIHSDLGQYDKALALEERVVAVRKAKLRPDHPDTLTSMANLAATYADLEQTDKALALELEVLEARKRTLGPAHPDTLQSMGNLAAAYSSLDQPDKAQPLEEEVLAAKKEKLGADHPETLTSMNNLAVTLDDLGKHDEAIPLKEQVLAGRRKALGPDHPDTLRSIHNLAASHYHCGAHEQAAALFLQALEQRYSVLGAEHADTQASKTWLAGIYGQLGEADKQRELDVRFPTVADTPS